MKISLKIIVLLFLVNPVFSQNNIPMIQATSNSVDIKVGETLYENQ